MGHAWCRGTRGGAGRREHAQGASAPGEEACRAPGLVGGPWDEGWNPFFCAVAVISVGGSECCLEAEKWAPPSFWRARGVLAVTPLCLYHQKVRQVLVHIGAQCQPGQSTMEGNSDFRAGLLGEGVGEGCGV